MHNSIKRIKTQERRKFVLLLRKSGVHYDEIVNAVYNKFKVEDLPKGYDERQCCQDVRRELKKLNEATKEETAELRRINNERLDDLLMTYFSKAKNGNIKAAEIVLKVLDRYGKYNPGLDVPIAVAPTDPTGQKEFGTSNIEKFLAANPEAREVLSDLFEKLAIDTGGTGKD